MLDFDDLGRDEVRPLGPKPGKGAVVHHSSREADFDGPPGDELPPREAVISDAKVRGGRTRGTPANRRLSVRKPRGSIGVRGQRSDDRVAATPRGWNAIGMLAGREVQILPRVRLKQGR
jgi:hypothetical protein